jgi:hypothetical protein
LNSHNIVIERYQLAESENPTGEWFDFFFLPQKSYENTEGEKTMTGQITP